MEDISGQNTLSIIAIHLSSTLRISTIIIKLNGSSAPAPIPEIVTANYNG